MKKFDRPNNISAVEVGSLRVQAIGPTQGVEAKVSLLTSNFQGAGLFVLRTWSPRSLEILRQLTASLEDDTVRLLTGNPEEGDELELESPGLMLGS